jgi:hypothetical protein
MERFGLGVQPRSHIHILRKGVGGCEGWTHTLPNGLPFRDFQKVIRWVQNSLDWKVLNSIGKFLRCRCLKWVRIIHLNIYNSYGRNNGQKSKCQFDSQPLKVRDHSNLHVCKGRAIYFGKLLTRATTLFWISSQLEVCIRSYVPPKCSEFQF